MVLSVSFKEKPSELELNQEFYSIVQDRAPDSLMGRDVMPEVSAERIVKLLELGAEAITVSRTQWIEDKLRKSNPELFEGEE